MRRVEIAIREARSEDAAAVAELLLELGYPSEREQVSRRLERLAAEPLARVYVATTGAGVVGLAGMRIENLVERNEPGCRLIALVVREGERGHGIGRRLVETIEKEARRLGCFGVVLTSADRRKDAHAFYRRLGYKDTGRRFVKDSGA